jgi:Na+/H+-dicarboxylate symporter
MNSTMVSSFDWKVLKRFLRNLRTVKSFVFYILPLSLMLGLFLPDASITFNSLGLALIQLISFPAIPLVLSAVVISTFSILSLSESVASEFRFTRRLFLSLVALVLFVSCFALLLSLYQKPGILSPDARFSIGTFMLDNADIKLRISSTVTETVDPFAWAKSIIPNNIVRDASDGSTLKVITGSVLFGWGLSLLPKEQSAPLLTIVRSIYNVSVKVLDELLLIAPLVIICLIAGSFSTISSEMVVALLNLTICMLVASLVSLGVSRLIVKRFTTSTERSSSRINPADSVFLLGLSTGSSMACYPTIVRSMERMGRNCSHSEAAASLGLLISRMGNIIYNIIAIMFALNLFEVRITPAILLQVLLMGIVSGISSAGLTGVTVVPTIGLALTSFQLPVPPVLVLLLAVDPILTLPRAATTGVLAMAVTVMSSDRDPDHSCSKQVAQELMV